MKDTFKTISEATEAHLYKAKNSKFFGYCYPIESETEVKPIIEQLRKLHPNAGHFCYAYQLGTEKIIYRANDDGEPSNSAGAPIYGQIQSFELTNILVVVARQFGGIKLGVGGLIAAYKTTAQFALEQTNIIEKTINIQFLISFDYTNINKVMRVIKEKNVTIVAQEMNMDEKRNNLLGIITIETRKKNAEMVFDIFSNLYEITINRK